MHLVLKWLIFYLIIKQFSFSLSATDIILQKDIDLGRPIKKKTLWVFQNQQVETYVRAHTNAYTGDFLQVMPLIDVHGKL